MTETKDVDCLDVVVSPASGAGWRIKALRRDGVFAVVVIDKAQALRLATRLYPHAQIRLYETLADGN